MKKLDIKMVINDGDDKIATVWTTEGLSRNSLTDLMTIKGMVDNFKNLLNEKIKTLLEKKL